MATTIIMPEMGEGVIEGTVARWLKQEGDSVGEYEPLLEIETDKVTTEATAEEPGTVLKIYVAEGETVPVGTVLAAIGEPGEDAPEAAEGSMAAAGSTDDGGSEAVDQDVPTMAEEAAPVNAAPARPASSNGGRETPADPDQPFANWASPVVKRIAEEQNVDLSKVPGSGRGGRTTKKDILAYLERREAQPETVPPTAAPTPAGRPAAPPPTAQPTATAGETVPMTSMRRRIAEHMVHSKRTSPHVTTIFEADFSAVVAHRAAHKEEFARSGARLTFTPYLIAATAQALREHPLVNSSWSDDGIVLHPEINIGVATALDEGLIVPVIKQADNFNLLGLARQVNDLATRARSNRLKPAEVQGGTFSITNHGVSGSLFATPIINQPQTGILGVGKIEKRVKVINDAIAIRPMAYLGLTFDHRVLDGATADYFMARLKEILETW